MIEVSEAYEINRARDNMGELVRFCRMQPQDSAGRCDCYFFQNGKCIIAVPCDTEFAKKVPE